MSAFLDSSALVKRYADEPGSDLVRSVQSCVVSAIARAEVPAAIWRKQRIGELDADTAALLVEQFEWEWHAPDSPELALAVVGLGQRVLEEAAQACARHGLRAYDAVQLGSAIAARNAEPSLTAFLCFDHELMAAARAEGFGTVAA